MKNKAAFHMVPETDVHRKAHSCQIEFPALLDIWVTNTPSVCNNIASPYIFVRTKLASVDLLTICEVLFSMSPLKL